MKLDEAEIVKTAGVALELFPSTRIHAPTLLCLAALLACASSASALDIFSNARIGYAGGQSRDIWQTVTFPEVGPNDKLTLNWEILGDKDPWDRAASIHLSLPGNQQIQLGKSVTGFKGTTSHSQDLSNLAPLLSGGTFSVGAHIDTWVANAWRVNVSAELTLGANETPNPTWAGVAIPRVRNFGGGLSGDVSQQYTMVVPEDSESVKLTYFASGHGGDEFRRRRHHLYINGQEVWNRVPWRTDGPDFRDVNPTSGRWDGNGDGDTNDPYPIDRWSSDFSRAGWIPGDEVAPYEIDITQWASAQGSYTLELKVDGVADNGYWRVAAYVSGTAAVPEHASAAFAMLAGLAALRRPSR